MKEEDLPLDERNIENAHRVGYLITGHIKKTLTRAERRELDEWVAASEQHVELFEKLTDPEYRETALAWYEDLDTEQRLQRLKDRIRKRRPASLRLWTIAAAASVLMVAGLAGYLYFIAGKAKHGPVASTGEGLSTPPAADKVRLILDDGSIVGLDSTGDGKLAMAAHTRIVKKGNSITYDAAPGAAAVYHTLATTAGGQYQVVLPDGTTVWLNAQSSLRYPTTFKGDERRVELKGEAYFEVVASPSPSGGGGKRPFIVSHGNMEVTVLGTHFNVNAYGDAGAIETTLLEGRVRVSSGGNSQLLLPGQQAQVKDERIAVTAADTEAVTGWKEGKFIFRKTPLPAVLKEIERWYNTPIENKEGINKHLTATISRSLPLDKVLRLLEGTGDVHFITENGKVKVTP